MGVGAEIAATVVNEADYLDAPPVRVHQKDVPLPYAENLEKLSCRCRRHSGSRPRCLRRSEDVMAINITMPALSPTMEEGTLSKWLVKPGDTISSET